MNKLLKILVSSLVFVTSQIDRCHALEFSIHPSNKSEAINAVLAVGEVELDDDVQLRNFLIKLPKRRYAAVYLSSPGGNLYGGIRLGLFLRENRVKSVVEGGATCASACALAFLGGTDRDGKPWRSSSSNSKLGFHAFSQPGQTKIDTDEAQKIVADILRYGRAVDAPLDLLITNFMTPSSEITWISNQTLCDLGIKLWDVDQDKFLCK